MNKEEKTIILGDELYEQFIEGKQTIDTHELLNLFAKRINNLQSKIDKANEIIKDWEQNYNGLMKTNNIYIPEDKLSLFDLRNVLNDNKIQEIPQFKGTMEQLDDLCNIRKEGK